jgi:NADH-quinone oxidoreductase subunit K
MSAALLQHAMLLSVALFVVGAVGVFVRRNVITVLMCVELMLNGANLAFVTFNRSWGAFGGHGLGGHGLEGQVVVFFVLTVAAAEAALGLAIVIALQRHKDTLDIDAFDLMKG